jgi:hypothetical protein
MCVRARGGYIASVDGDRLWVPGTVEASVSGTCTCPGTSPNPVPGLQPMTEPCFTSSRTGAPMLLAVRRRILFILQNARFPKRGYRQY